MSNHLSSDERTAAVQVGRRLREARELAGLSLREVAQRVGLRDHTVIMKYERGETPPSSTRLRSLALAVGCSAAALLAEHDDAVALIGAVDRADTARLAQLQFVLESLDVPPPVPPEP